MARSASDIPIIAGMPAAYKIHGLIRREGNASSPRTFRPWWEELYHLAGERDMKRLLEVGDDDFSLCRAGPLPLPGPTPSSSAAPWDW